MKTWLFGLVAMAGTLFVAQPAQASFVRGGFGHHVGHGVGYGHGFGFRSFGYTPVAFAAAPYVQAVGYPVAAPVAVAAPSYAAPVAYTPCPTHVAAPPPVAYAPPTVAAPAPVVGGYGAPAYAAPVFAAAPVYAAPTYAAPVFAAAPVYAAPTYAAPVFASHSYGFGFGNHARFGFGNHHRVVAVRNVVAVNRFAGRRVVVGNRGVAVGRGFVPAVRVRLGR